MPEMKSLTLNDTKYDSFVDQTARKDIETLKTNGTGGTVSEEQIAQAVEDYMAEHPVSGCMTAARIEAIHGLFKVCGFVKDDISAEYNAFMVAFGISDSGDDSGGSGEGESGDETHTHSYTSSVTKAATCDTAGVRTYTCECGESYTEAIPATGHKYMDGVCTVCGAADPDAGVEVEIFEPEANTVVTTTLSIDNTLVNIDTGATATNASWCASDYVAIPGGKDYLAIQTENSSSIRYALYDSEKVFIKGGNLGSVTAIAIEYPENAAYIRLSTNNKTTIGTVTLSAGNNMVTSWGEPGNNGLTENGDIAASAAAYRISDGYVMIPDGAKTLFWCNKAGYSFTKTECVVYDGSYVGVGHAGSNTLGGGVFGQNFVQNKIDLTTLNNAMYFKAHVNDASNANNNNPAEQYVIGYI